MEERHQISAWLIEILTSYREYIGVDVGVKTLEAYTADIMKFMRYLQAKGIKRLSQIKGQMIVSYLGYQKSLGKSNASLNRYCMSISSLIMYLRITKAIKEDLMLQVRVPRNKPKSPYVPSMLEIDAILAVPDNLQDKAILELLYSSGLRASELCDLDIRDVESNQIVVRLGKGDNNRSVPMTPSACSAIQAYIQVERGTHAGPLFQTVTGKKILRQNLSRMVTRCAKEAGIEGVTTHTLRHACATHLLDQGADLRLIQEVLGHSSIVSTQRYTQLSSSKIQDKFQQFHPRREKND